MDAQTVPMRARIGSGHRYVNSHLSHDDSPMQFALDDFWVRMLQDLIQGRDRSGVALAPAMVAGAGMSS